MPDDPDILCIRRDPKHGLGHPEDDFVVGKQLCLVDKYAFSS